MAKTSNTPNNLTGWTVWGSTLLHALPVAALMLLLFYYWFAVADRYYVSDSDNFFARNIGVQLGTWVVSGGLALGMTRLGGKVAARLKLVPPVV